MWRVAATRRHLLRPEVDDEQIQGHTARRGNEHRLYAMATVVAIVPPHVAAFGYLLTAFALVLRVRVGDRPAAGLT